jgi:hypothetical protein
VLELLSAELGGGEIINDVQTRIWKEAIVARFNIPLPVRKGGIPAGI